VYISTIDANSSLQHTACDSYGHNIIHIASLEHFAHNGDAQNS